MQASGQHKLAQRSRISWAIPVPGYLKASECSPRDLISARLPLKVCARQNDGVRRTQPGIVDARTLNADIESFIDPIRPSRIKRQLKTFGAMELWRKGFETPDFSSRDGVVRPAIATHECAAIREELLPVSTKRSLEA